MPITIAGPFTNSVPIVQPSAIVAVKQTFADLWKFEPTLEFVSGGVAAASEGIDEATFVRTYGRVLEPWQKDPAQRGPVDLTGWWVRVELAADQGQEMIFVGRLTAPSREIFGSHVQVSGVPIRTGEQSWTAYGGLDLLRRIQISRHVCLFPEEQPLAPDPGEERDLAELPGINAGGGNRSSYVGPSDTYCYGGRETWTHLEYLYYLVRHHVASDGGPTWTVGGELGAVDALTEVIEFAKGTKKVSAADVIRALVARERGLDWLVRPTAAGFEIEIFSLVSQSFSFGGKTLPANPDSIKFTADQYPEVISCVIEPNHDHVYGKIRVIGKPILVCCSLRGELAHPEYEGSLDKKWEAALEAAYKAGTGTPADTAEAHDRARQDAVYRPVYQSFGAPDDWDHQGGQAAPVLDAAGTLAVGGDYQNVVRNTEDWTPLREGWDYSVDPALDKAPELHEEDYLPPACWILCADDVQGGVAYHRYRPAELLGIHVSAPRNDWGVFLEPFSQHLLADGSWTGAAATEAVPIYDWREMVATIAFYADQRLELVQEVPGVWYSDAVLDVRVDDAEFWFLAPKTVVGTDKQGQLVTSGSSGRILRDDRERLASVMAAVMSRYLASRTKAVIQIRGWWPYHTMVGKILESVEDIASSTLVHAPITAVKWNTAGDTLIESGFVDHVFESAFDDPKESEAGEEPYTAELGMEYEE